MQNRRAASVSLAVLLCVSIACALPASAAPTATIASSPTLLLPTPVPASPTVAAVASVSPTLSVSTSPAVIQGVPAAFCSDSQPTALINSLKSALQNSSGDLLASLVSPAHGMDARLYRDGRVANYDQQHARFLFTSTYAMDWGAAPGSGLETTVPFHDTILPALLDVFSRQYTLTCDQIQVGGTTYQAAWPYPGIHFYSAYYPGTQSGSSLDWHTWLLGMHYVNGKPYLYAIMQFQWEP